MLYLYSGAAWACILGCLNDLNDVVCLKGIVRLQVCWRWPLFELANDGVGRARLSAAQEPTDQAK